LTGLWTASVGHVASRRSNGHSVVLQDMQGAEDDDSWMRDGADVLEKELAARQTEMKASASDQLPNADFDPEHLAERMKVDF
jgi:hypothetical protein